MQSIGSWDVRIGSRRLATAYSATGAPRDCIKQPRWRLSRRILRAAPVRKSVAILLVQPSRSPANRSPSSDTPFAPGTLIRTLYPYSLPASCMPSGAPSLRGLQYAKHQRPAAETKEHWPDRNPEQHQQPPCSAPPASFIPDPGP